MNVGLSLLLLAAIGVGAHCGIDKASDRQERALETQCQCSCDRVPADDVHTRAWLAGEPLTVAWGGGFWQCARPEGKK